MDKSVDADRRRLLQAAAGAACLSLTGPGVAAVAGRVLRPGARSTGWPAWRRSMRAHTWCAVPALNTLRAIDPSRNPALNPYLANNPNDNRGPWGAVLGQTGVIAPWCGGCYDRDGDTLWLPLGGGHGDYAGNEAYAIRLADEAPQWRMPRPPSGSIPLGLITLNDGQEASGLYADGRPRAIHSYNKHVYVPGRGPFCTVQGSTYSSGQAGTARSMLLDPASGEWTLRSAHPAPGVEYGAAAYDETRDAVWWLGAGGARLSRHNLATNQWQVFTAGSESNVWSYHALSFVPAHDVLVMLSANLPQQFAVWDAASAQMLQPGASNAPPAHLSQVGGKAGGQWVPGLNAVAMWHNENAASTGAITVLRSPANPRTQPWTWDSLPVAAANTVVPSVAVAAGTYGRFGHAPGLQGFYVLNSIDGPVYFYALSDGDFIFSNGFDAA